MSATGLSSIRHPDDWYVTQPSVTRAILPHLPSAGCAIDPAAGTGEILDVLRASGRYASTRGYEIDAGRAAECAKRGHSVETRESLSVLSWDAPDLVVMNPPFRLALEFVTRAIAEAPDGGTVAVLLRLNWLASAGRASFHRRHPSDVYILSSRPEFAASLRCKVKCGWEVLQRIDAPRAKACPSCGGKVTVITTDSTEYAWFCFGPGRGNRWFLLDAEPK